jgi:hypothetical protein
MPCRSESLRDVLIGEFVVGKGLANRDLAVHGDSGFVPRRKALREHFARL